MLCTDDSSGANTTLLLPKHQTKASLPLQDFVPHVLTEPLASLLIVSAVSQGKNAFAEL